MHLSCIHGLLYHMHDTSVYVDPYSWVRGNIFTLKYLLWAISVHQEGKEILKQFLVFF